MEKYFVITDYGSEGCTCDDYDTIKETIEGIKTIHRWNPYKVIRGELLELDLKVEEEKMTECKCDPLEKLIITNFPMFRCPKCGEWYFSPGKAKVIDKCHLGNTEERKKRGLEY
jgi:YgiT-type zinc finger domain-containing protein